MILTINAWQELYKNPPSSQLNLLFCLFFCLLWDRVFCCSYLVHAGLLLCSSGWPGTCGYFLASAFWVHEWKLSVLPWLANFPVLGELFGRLVCSSINTYWTCILNQVVGKELRKQRSLSLHLCGLRLNGGSIGSTTVSTCSRECCNVNTCWCYCNVVPSVAKVRRQARPLRESKLGIFLRIWVSGRKGWMKSILGSIQREMGERV